MSLKEHFLRNVMYRSLLVSYSGLQTCHVHETQNLHFLGHNLEAATHERALSTPSNKKGTLENRTSRRPRNYHKSYTCT